MVTDGLCGIGPARPTRIASYSVSVRQVAALLPRFFQTAPRGRPPLRLASPLSHQTWAEDLHLQAVKHARHTRSRGRQARAHRSLQNAQPRFAQLPQALLKRLNVTKVSPMFPVNSVTDVSGCTYF